MRRGAHRTVALALILCAIRSGSDGAPAADAVADHGSVIVHGVTVSCRRSGESWGTDSMAAALDELAALGVNWVATHPYARIRADGAVEWRALDPVSPPAWLARPVREAHARGLAFLLKPHLAYWGSPFRSFAEIDFPDPAARARFWREYRSWMLALARAVPDVDGLVIGTELDRFLADEAEWRALVADLREITAARLTYAANWSEYERVPFWDVLDAVGVQAYFPLVGAEERGEPDEAALAAGWEAVLARLRAVHARTGKPVVFTEIGYNLSLAAAREPWAYPVAPPEERERAAALQARCLRVALDVLERERDWLRGAFLWKWFPGDPGRENFLLNAPNLREVLGSAWGAGAAGR